MSIQRDSKDVRMPRWTAVKENPGAKVGRRAEADQLLEKDLDLSGLSLLLALLGEKDRVDVGQHTARGNCDRAKQLGELFVVADGQLDVTGDDAVLLVVAGCVPGKLQDLCGNVLEDGSQVDRGAGSNAVSVLALLQVAGHSADGELQSSHAGTGLIE